MWLLSLDYCMYFYTEITYVLYATSAILFYFLRFPIFLSHEAAICLSVHLLAERCILHRLALTGYLSLNGESSRC